MKFEFLVNRNSVFFSSNMSQAIFETSCQKKIVL
jgi:hypothetical protein